MKEKLITINGIQYYANHFCKHCGKNIKYAFWHKWRGISNYCWGHSPNGIKFNFLTCYGKYGKEHPRYIDGYWKERQRSKRRGLGFIPLNDKTKINNEMHHLGDRLVIFMPERIHRSIYHSIKSGKRLKEMNRLAYNVLFGFDVGKL